MSIGHTYMHSTQVDFPSRLPTPSIPPDFDYGMVPTEESVSGSNEENAGQGNQRERSGEDTGSNENSSPRERDLGVPFSAGNADKHHGREPEEDIEGWKDDRSEDEGDEEAGEEGNSEEEEPDSDDDDEDDVDESDDDYYK